MEARAGQRGKAEARAKAEPAAAKVELVAAAKVAVAKAAVAQRAIPVKRCRVIPATQ